MSTPGGSLGTFGIDFEVRGVPKAQSDMDGLAASVGNTEKSFDKVSKSAEKTGVNLKKLSFAVFGLSLSVTNILQSVRRFENQLISIDKKAILLERTKISLRQQVDRLEKSYSKGTLTQEQYSIALDKIRSTEDLVKTNTKDLENEQKSLNDTYINFAFNISSSLLFSFVAMREALKNVTFAQIQATIGAKAMSARFRAMIFDAGAASIAIRGFGITLKGMTAGTISASLGITLLGRSFKGLFAAIGPVGWAILGISTAIELLMVFEDQIKGVLGLETEAAKIARLAKEEQKSLTEAFGDFNDVLGDTGSRFDNLFTKYDRTLQELAKVKGAVIDTANAFQQTGGGTGVSQSFGAGGGSSSGTRGGLFHSVDTPSEALAMQAKNEASQATDKFLFQLRERNVLLSDARNFISDELSLTNNLVKKREILLKIQDEIHNSYSDSNGELTTEGKILERALIIERAILEAKRQKVVSQREHNAELERENKLNDEIKKKRELLFQQGILFLSRAKSAAREIFEVNQNRIRLFAEIGRGLEGSIAGFISGVFNNDTGAFRAGQQTNDLAVLQHLFNFQSEAISEGNLGNFNFLQAEINKFLRGSNIAGSTDILTQVARTLSSQGLTGANASKSASGNLGSFFRANAAQFSAGRLSNTNRAGGTTIGAFSSQLSSGRQGASVSFGGSRASGRSSKHGGRNRSIQFNANQRARSVIIGAYTAYADVLTPEEIDRIVSNGRFVNGFGVTQPDAIANTIRAEALRRRREIFLAMQREINAGLQSRFDREKRFAEHVSQFGLESVQASGGTSINFNELIPFFQKMITANQDAKDRTDLEQIITLVKGK